MKAIAILFLFVALQSKAVTINNSTCWNLEKFTIECCKDLGIKDGFITIQTTRGLINGKYFAVVEGKDGIFNIGLSDRMHYDECLSAVAHELVHIEQLQSGRLKVLNRNTVGFNGALQRVTDETHIDDEHEKEAAMIGNMLVNKYNPY